VRRGEHGTAIVFWKIGTREDMIAWWQARERRAL
jgi:hypothetical protein